MEENRDVGQQENMAEAAVENPAATFFCHRCTQEINPVLPDYTCPRCQSGFIEEVTTQGPTDTSDEAEEDFNPLGQIADLWTMLHYMRGPEDLYAPGPAAQESRDGRNVSRPGPSRRARFSRIPSRRGNTEESNRQRADGFLQHLVSSLSENAGFVTNASVPVFLNLHSNPGDYAWGRGGWNAIINQLINQLDVTGPPPLSKEKINEIPVVEISQEQVDKNLQCTVCMEDFKLSEPVRRLSCEHNFHNECIIPWLELHGTCPICRKLLNDGIDSFASNLPDSFMSDSSVTNQESPQSNPVPDSDDLSSVSRNYNPHQPSVYDFNDEFD